ncbi:MAG TPA: hypothetical protein PL151_10635 [Phycisphaerae bacterium]|nr:hypothetical protein [Phycisphaerae bacterium]HOJ74571.1 hypothetical protein [Phycisphaerae bacterium]HOM52772.1 hypothetical protein [Phycisphaerae bacterium]HON66818.1 hypothetical protein [Phycisphaerae bacterium]HOQ87217.1 hypothetical protein [Phycisphaerae bacterium]
MGFAGGSITFKRFFVQGNSPQRVDEALIEQLSARAMGRDSIQTADHTEMGWITGEHILDTSFSFAKNAVGDGLAFSMRIDTNKPPSDLVRSYQRQNEAALLEASGREFLSKAERRQAREEALARAEAEAREGAFRRMKQVPVFWDLKRNEVYLGSTGNSVAEPFMTLFRMTFGLMLVPVSSSELAARWAAHAGEARAFDDCKPAHFVQPPDGAVSADDYENEVRGKDFLGTEWLVWLWYTSQIESAQVSTQLGKSVTVLFEKSVQLECAFGITGKLSVQADDPTHLPEAAVALAEGKRPVRVGLQLAASGESYGLNLRGDVMHYSGVQLPPPEDASNPRAIFEDRIEKLRDMIQACDDLYTAFIRKRLSNRWPQTLNAMRAWVAAGRHRAPAAEAATA